MKFKIIYFKAIILLFIISACITQKPSKELLAEDKTTSQNDTTFKGLKIKHNLNCYTENEDFIISINRIDSNQLALRVSCKNKSAIFTYPFDLYHENNTIKIINPKQQERFLYSFLLDGYTGFTPARHSKKLKEKESIEENYNFREHHFNILEGGIDYENMGLEDENKKINFFEPDGIYQLIWIVKYKVGDKEKEIQTPPFNYYYSLVPIPLFSPTDTQ